MRLVYRVRAEAARCSRVTPTSQNETNRNVNKTPMDSWRVTIHGQKYLQVHRTRRAHDIGEQWASSVRMQFCLVGNERHRLHASLVSRAAFSMHRLLSHTYSTPQFCFTLPNETSKRALNYATFDRRTRCVGQRLTDRASKRVRIRGLPRDGIIRRKRSA